MKIKKIASILVMAISINTIGASFVFAASPNNTTAVNVTVESRTKAPAPEVITPVKKGDVVQPNSVGSVAVKAGVKWLKSHYTTVIKRIPVKWRKYIAANVFFEALDYYTQYSDKLHDVITYAISYLLPASAQGAVPAIVFVIELIIPI